MGEDKSTSVNNNNERKFLNMGLSNKCLVMLKIVCVLSSLKARYLLVNAQDAKNIVETAKSNTELSKLVQVVTAAGLVDTLNEVGPFTVFAPNNDAIAKIPKDEFDELSKPANKE